MKFIFLILLSFILSCTTKEYKNKFGGLETITQFEYYEDQRKKSEFNFCVFGDSILLNNYSYTYYKNGEVEIKTHYDEGKLIGSTFYYFENGNINKYYFYNYFGKVIYAVEYDSLGFEFTEINKNCRKPVVLISTMKYHSIIKKLLLEGTMNIKIYSAELSDTNKDIYLFNSKGIKIDSIIDSKEPYEEFYIAKNTEVYFVVINYYFQSVRIESDTTFFKLIPDEIERIRNNLPCSHIKYLQ